MCDEINSVDRKQWAPEAANRKSVFQLPALQALLMQFLSLAIVFALLMIFPNVFGVQMPIVAAVILQGLCAAGLSRWRRLAPWWLLIQAVFLPALFAGAMLHLPPQIYLGAFLFFLVLYWSTFRTQVPFYPSGPAAWAAVAELLPKSHPIRFVDVGSGFGGMVFHLARSRGDSEFIGIELAPLPWLASRMTAWFARARVQFLRDDYNHLDFGEFDVVFAYLSPAAMPALWQKARAEMRTGSLLLSYEFAIAEAESQITNISVVNGRNLYGWNM
ncbi:MAG TPA: methyltransferase domain-containing protein [Burkholderiaceae bacterium]|jgi:hypothetical protein|nr:methyltransferase domain-containing protein [Burkholderiaceae bacterium]